MALRGAVVASKATAKASIITAKATAAASEMLGSGLADAGMSLGRSAVEVTRHLWRNRRQYTAAGFFAGFAAMVGGAAWLARDAHLAGTFGDLVGNFIGLSKGSEPVIEPGVTAAVEVGGLGGALFAGAGISNAVIGHTRRERKRHEREMHELRYSAGLDILELRSETRGIAAELLERAQVMAELPEPTSTLYFAACRSELPEEPYTPRAEHARVGRSTVYYARPVPEPAFA